MMVFTRVKYWNDVLVVPLAKNTKYSPVQRNFYAKYLSNLFSPEWKFYIPAH